MKINNCILILAFLVSSYYSVPITNNIYTSLIQKDINLSHYNNNLRQKHMNNISFVQGFLINFSSLKMSELKTDKISMQLKKYFKDTEMNIKDLNKE